MNHVTSRIDILKNEDFRQEIARGVIIQLNKPENLLNRFLRNCNPSVLLETVWVT